MSLTRNLKVKFKCSSYHEKQIISLLGSNSSVDVVLSRACRAGADHGVVRSCSRFLSAAENLYFLRDQLRMQAL